MSVGVRSLAVGVRYLRPTITSQEPTMFGLGIIGTILLIIIILWLLGVIG